VCARSSDPGQERLVAWRSDRWTLRHHAHPAPLGGWFQLESNRHVGGAADFTDAEATEFGAVLRASCHAVREVTGAMRVYAIAFGEGSAHVHVHLVPRMPGRDDTAAWKVADWYRLVEREPGRAAEPAHVEEVIRQVAALLPTLFPQGILSPTPTGS